MTPKQKAQELYIYNGGKKRNMLAIRAAMHTVTEVINANPHSNPLNSPVTSTMAYWQEVLTELKMM